MKSYSLLVLPLLLALVRGIDGASSGGEDQYADDYYDGGIFGSMADTDIVIGSSSVDRDYCRPCC